MCFARTILPVISLFLGTVSEYLHADALSPEITINISATVIVPPCTVNNGDPININFRNISISDIANTSYVKKQSVPVKCAYFNGTPYVKISGEQLTGGASNVLKTSITNFGIALYQGDGQSKPMNIGEGSDGIGYAITTGYSGMNVAEGTYLFTAVPYQTGNSALTAGSFQASATMSIIYK